MDAQGRPALILGILLLLGFVVADCAHSPRTAVGAAPAARAVRSKRYRFLPYPGWSLPDGRSAWITEEGRLAMAPDGAIELAPSMRRQVSGGIPVPVRLGGGFLFWDPDLYRTRTFLGPFEPVADPFQIHMIDVRFGHDSLLILGEGGERHRYDMERAKRLPLSPHGVMDIEGADDDRVIATDAVGRAFVSTDGGGQWTDVTAKLGAPIVQLHGASTAVWFQLRREEDENVEGVWLQPNGQLTRGIFLAGGAPEDTSVPSPAEAAPGASIREIELAVSSGIPLSEGRALVAEGARVRVVDAETGQGDGPARDVGPEGASCEPLSLDEEGIVACYGPSYRYGYGPDFFAVVSHVLAAHPRAERRFEGQPTVSYAAGSLLVGGRCSGAREAGFVCERRARTWREHDLRKALGGKEVAFWVPKEGGGVAAILGHVTIPGFVPDPVWFDGDSGALVALSRSTDAGARSILKTVNGPRHGAQNTRTEWIVTRDGTLRGFTTTGSIAVDTRGHEMPGPQAMAYLAAFGGRALARDGEYRLWQSTDYGATWALVEPPPYDPPRSLQPEESNLPMRCSLVGCSLNMLEFGKWVRIGWPEDPPKLAQRPGRTDEAALDAGLRPEWPPSPPLPTLECAGPGGRAPKGPNWPGFESTDKGARSDSGTPAQIQPTPLPAGDVFAAVFGGRRMPVRLAGRTFANVDYRDHFENSEEWPSYALRAVAHYEGLADLYGSTLDEYPAVPGGNPRSLSDLVQSRKPIDVLFREDFDPMGRVVEAKGSFSQWSSVLGNRFTNGADGRARPVLSTEPGHSGGVLLIDDGLALWADNRGAVHPVEPGRMSGSTSPSSMVFGGYVDREGKLFVTWSSSVETADGSRTLLEAPNVFLGYPAMKPHYKSVAPDMGVEGHDFLNPDVVAVGKDGRVGIVRLPSGTEPSTVDDPAWWITKDDPPVELAPWSTLQLATSAACARTDDGIRAIVQTPLPWVTVAGSSGFGGGRRAPEQPGMKALVRWSEERVCLEAIELGYLGRRGPENWRHRLTEVMLVARFVGRDSGASLIAFTASAAYRETVSCKLRP
jgi:hypothetical protein